jgi:hypothetical protein
MNLTLIDLFAPYLLRGENLGAVHAYLAALRVVSWEMAADDDAIVLRGRAEVNGNVILDIPNGRFRFVVDEGAPPFDPNRRGPVFDLRETTVDFELFSRRIGSSIIDQGRGGADAAARAVLDTLDAAPLDLPTSDFPASNVTIDLVLNAPSFRPPGLHPARMSDRGLLIPLPNGPEVAFILPKIKLRIAHGPEASPQLTVAFASAGVAGLDDPGDIGVAEMVSMVPPYALVGGPSDRSFGFGFRSAVLDLSQASTPPAVIQKFGFGDDWTGLYLPDLSIFIAPDGAEDFAFKASAHDLLIGFGAASGVSGDFELALIDQGEGNLVLGARFYDSLDRGFGFIPDAGSNGRSGSASLPELTHLVIDVSGGIGPYAVTLAQDAAAAQPGRVFDVDLSGGPVTLTIAASDSTAGTPKTATLTIRATRNAKPAMLPPPQGSVPPGQIVATSRKPAFIDPPATGTPRIRIAFETATDVVLTTEPASPATMWSAGGVDGGPAATFSLPVTPGAAVTVMASLPEVAGAPAQLLEYWFYFDEPDTVQDSNEEALLGAYATSLTDPADPSADLGDNVSTVRALAVSRAQGREPGAQSPFTAYHPLLEALPPGTPIAVIGDVSYEGNAGTEKRNYNYALARRRALAVAAALRRLYPDRAADISHVPADKDASPSVRSAWLDSIQWTNHGPPNQRDHWLAKVAIPAGATLPARQASAVVKRPPDEANVLPPVPKDPPPAAAPSPPGWLRAVFLRARLYRNILVAAELEAKVDFQTVAEEKLQGAPAGAPQGRILRQGQAVIPANPADGLTTLRLLCQADQTSGRIVTQMQIGADPADTDGLYAFGWMPGESATQDDGVDFLGSTITFWPLIADVADGTNGALADAAITVGMMAGVFAGVKLTGLQADRVILYGAEYLQREQGGALEGFVLFDLQTDWSGTFGIFGLDLLDISRDNPLSVRYKAIGIRLANRLTSGEQAFSFNPVFDASRGFTIDVARSGSLRVKPPFDKVLRIAAARLSRTNPLTFEIDLMPAIDLGVVSIDRAAVRIYLDGARPPELTAFGASVDVAGVIKGSGYMALTAGASPGTSAFSGQVDVSLVPLSLRIAAAVKVESLKDGGRDLTAIYLGLNVVLPVGIPLGASGLGIFGFRGIFGMHFRRSLAHDDAASGAPSMGWLAAAAGKPHLLQNPDNGKILWEAQADNWAFGIGALLGTMEGGVLVNLDGTLLLELPGPRLAILMNARILSPPPSMEGVGSSGGVLAIIEMTPSHFLIGIILDYNIEDLIKIHVPAEAFFPFDDPSEWHVYLGTRASPASVEVLGLVKGSGYLMIDGAGLPAYPIPGTGAVLPEITGFAIGLGAAASLTFGSRSAGLYLRVSGSFDAVLGFEPLILAGHFHLSGELRLFIVSIGASADLTVVVREIGGGLDVWAKGEACGKVEFLFFDVEGCVTVEIGSEPDASPMPPLVRKLSLKSRSPALVTGSGTDRPIDASLGDGVADPGDAAIVTVPIDTIPMLSMVVPPVADGLAFAGEAVGGSSGGPGPGQWSSKGSEHYRYTLTGVTLERDDGGEPLTGSRRPATWITAAAPGEPTPSSTLALLSYTPEAASRAFELTEQRSEEIRHRWETVCQDAAPPAPVLWTFLPEPPGPDEDGWQLTGRALPDPPGTRRSAPPPLGLRVTEVWRTGLRAVDAILGVVPALVVGGAVDCADERVPDPPPRLDPRRRIRELPLLREQRVPKLLTPLERPTAALAAVLLTVQQDPATVLAAMAQGQAVSRQAMIGALFTSPGLPPGASRGSCLCEVLQAPMRDTGNYEAAREAITSEAIDKAVSRAKDLHGPLQDVVVLHTGEIAEGFAILFTGRALLEAKRLMLRGLDGSGAEVWRQALSSADLLGSLPPEWIASGSGWTTPLRDVLSWDQDPRGAGYVEVLARLDRGAERVEIGVLPGAEAPAPVLMAAVDNRLRLRPAYYLAAVVLTARAEVERHGFDKTEIERDRAILMTATGPAASEEPLLQPGALYRVTAHWQGRRESDNAATGDKNQIFWFRTDAQAPARLDPWLLLTQPQENESAVFTAAAQLLAFNTTDVDRLFAAYGLQLRVRLTAASAHHPRLEPDGPPFVLLQPTDFMPAGSVVLSPWEDAVRELLPKLPCVAQQGDTHRQSLVSLQLPLDPYTGYHMDVETVPLAPPGEAVPDSVPGTRILRRHFTTGGYPSLVAFAGHIAAARIGNRALPDATAPAAIAANFAGRDPAGAEFDAALRQLGLEPRPGLPGRPLVTVLWQSDAVPQPLAVLVEAPEPLWRSRLFPSRDTDTSGPVPVLRWILRDTAWLRPEPAATSTASLLPNGLIRAPGGERALLILAPGARGKRLQLDLFRPAVTKAFMPSAEERHPIVDAPFDRAPWED